MLLAPYFQAATINMTCEDSQKTQTSNIHLSQSHDVKTRRLTLTERYGKEALELTASALGAGSWLWFKGQNKKQPMKAAVKRCGNRESYLVTLLCNSRLP